MTWRGLLTSFAPGVLILALPAGTPARAGQVGSASARTLIEPFAGKTIAGEVMSVDREKRILVVRVIEEGRKLRDVSVALDDRTVLKKLRTAISGGDLTPGHLVTVTYREHAGRLVARRIEVTGKAVHQPMP